MNTLPAIAYCIVGCNVGSPDMETLHVLRCDTATGSAEIVQTVRGYQGTTYFQADAEQKTLYTMIGEKKDGREIGCIVKFAIDGHRLGEMTRICQLPCEAPCHIALSPDGTRIAFAAYGSGTVGTVRIDGSDLRTFVFPNDAMGPNAKRQKKAYAHQVFFTQPVAGRPLTMGAVDLGCDRIWFFDPATMQRNKNLSIRFAAGDGPRHALFSPGSQDKVLYVVNELGSSVATFAYDGARFGKLDKTTMLPKEFNRWAADGETLATKAAAIKTTADGNVLMASNRGHDSIAIYSVDQTGRLTLKNIAKLKGKFPRDFALMPGEKFVVVGHKLSNEIQVYRFDRGAYTLTPVGKPIACWRPLCFQFLTAR